MLHDIACAAIAYFLARYLNVRFPGLATAVWSSAVATISGMVIGSALVFGGMAAVGSALDPLATVDKVPIQGCIWSVVGAAAGVFHGRRKAASADHGEVTSLPAFAWFGLCAMSIALVFCALSFTGKISASNPSTVGKPAPQRLTDPVQPPAVQQAGPLDRDGQPCTQITEFLGECKRQP